MHRRPTRSTRLLAPPLQQVDRTRVRWHGRKFAYFAGCDYFRLASHPAVLRALREGLEKFGLNVAASRATTGNHRLFALLEQRLAAFFGVEDAVLVSSGYLSNQAVTQTLAGRFSHALIDERAHNSLVDAAQFLDCPIYRFKHRDAVDVARILARLGQWARPILLTDGLFSHDGSVAPLKLYRHTLPTDGWLLVDDAHAAGILGRMGRGTAELEGISRARLIQTVALSKAFGVYGGAVLTTRALAREIRARSRLFNGNTPLPLPLAAAALRALSLVRTDPLIERLARKTAYVKSALRAGGFPVTDSPAPIVALAPPTRRDRQRCERRLLHYGVFPSFIRYPGGPAKGYFRFALSSEHSRAQLDALVAALLESAKDFLTESAG
ncbi:MAG: aminotransferase class I/II-fold pyridoxal phosphate-dependent enzyme [Verrucomicrobia bacterium]|nr:aminotransferase class I/II-fold pyridoxal phosphate-dependent enzyme [Verrucomicrobiota bacterium]